jgi:dUTP pyrophosphatase
MNKEAYNSKVVYVKLLHPQAKIRKATEGSVGYDIFSTEEKVIHSWSRETVSTGISLEILEPEVYARILPRSSLSSKNGILIGAGVIDRDYRGEIKVVMFNLSNEDYKVSPEIAIAQIVFQRYSNVSICIKDKLSKTERGDKGFGSSDSNITKNL